MGNKPDLSDYFMTGRVDRIYHQRYCYEKALNRAIEHFPKRRSLQFLKEQLRKYEYY